MDIQKISKLSGVLGVRLVTHEPRDVVEIANNNPTVGIALNTAMMAVAELGDCRLLVGSKDNGVTVTGMRFDEAGVTVLVATMTGHRVAKSLRRLMRTVAGQKRQYAKTSTPSEIAA